MAQRVVIRVRQTQGLWECQGPRRQGGWLPTCGGEAAEGCGGLRRAVEGCGGLGSSFAEPGLEFQTHLILFGWL